MTPPFSEELLEEYAESEHIHHIVSSPRSVRVYDLSPNLIAKYYEPVEIEDALRATEVATQLGIRCPSVRKTFNNGGAAFVIMDRIKGNTLDQVWNRPGWLMTIKLGLQLRRFLNIFRSVTSPTAGSLATGECRSSWLEDRFGLPVSSGRAEIAHFFRFWTSFTSPKKAMQVAKQLPVPEEPLLLVIEPFVFTHHDLAPRNLILSASGHLTLLDWDLAGFYPVPFEYAAMYNFQVPRDWKWMARWRWHSFVWIAVGYREADARLLRIIRSKSTRYANGRRFELL